LAAGTGAGTGAGTESPGVIVVADDDPGFLEFVSALLERVGYSTLAVSSGEDALEAVRGGGVRLLVLDIQLPGLSGYEVCREVRDELGDGIPILFVSGVRTESFDRVSGILVGADDYLVKPFAPDELLARVRRLLSRSASPPNVRFELTPREHEIISLLAEGLTTVQIQRRLVISPKTVGTHLGHIYAKLGVRSRSEAVALAYRENLVGPHG